MGSEYLGHWVEGIDDPPGDDPPINPILEDRDPRDAVLEALKTFCLRLDFRLELFTGRDPSMLAVFESDVSLQAEMIRQKVHTFIGRELIERIASALGYEYIAEPRHSRRELDENREQIYPDFRLIPDRLRLSTHPYIIGEIKIPGALSEAVEQLREYLQKVEGPAYGIATDGIVWRGLMRKESEVINLPEVSHVFLKQLLHKIRRDIVHEQATYDLIQLRTSDSLNRFLTIFDQMLAEG